MLCTFIFACAASIGVVVSHPFDVVTAPKVMSLRARSPWQPSVGASWQIILSQKLKINSTNPTITPDVEVFDIDMFSHLGTSTIVSLHKLNKKVICYFSAGSYEPGRPDSALFTPSVMGFGLQGWPGEFWLDITSPFVRSLMAARVLLAARMGCDAIDPDNVDGYQNKNGLKLTSQNSIDYIKFLAAEAAKYNMGIGLKNALDIVPDVLPYVQFAVNEQCAQYEECSDLQRFIASGKPVFHIEYTDAAKSKRSIEGRGRSLATNQGFRLSSERLGCYVDSTDRHTFQAHYDDDDDMTPRACQRYCSSYTYFGLGRGDRCFCSNTMASLSKQPDADCRVKCPGDGDQTCGGRNRIEMYQKNGLVFPTTTTSARSQLQSSTTRRLTTTTKATSINLTTSSTITTIKTQSNTSMLSSPVTKMTTPIAPASITTTKSTTTRSTTTIQTTSRKTTSQTYPASTQTLPSSGSAGVGNGSNMSCTAFKNISGFSTVIKKLVLDNWVQFCGGRTASTLTQ